MNNQEEEEIQKHMHDQILIILIELLGTKILADPVLKVLAIQKPNLARNPNSLPFIMALMLMRYMDIPLKSKFGDVIMHKELIDDILQSVELLESRIKKAVAARKEGFNLKDIQTQGDA